LESNTSIMYCKNTMDCWYSTCQVSAWKGHLQFHALGILALQNEALQPVTNVDKRWCRTVPVVDPWWPRLLAPTWLPAQNGMIWNHPELGDEELSRQTVLLWFEFVYFFFSSVSCRGWEHHFPNYCAMVIHVSMNWFLAVSRRLWHFDSREIDTFAASRLHRIVFTHTESWHHGMTSTEIWLPKKWTSMEVSVKY